MPTSDQKSALDALLASQQTVGSAEYHRWITPEQYAERFGLSSTDVGSIRNWLQEQGLTVDEVAHSRTWLRLSGSARQIETAFQTELHRYNADGHVHIANATAPSLPAQLGDAVHAIRGLNDFQPRPFKHMLRSRETGNGKPAYTSSKGNHYISPADLAAIYNFTPLYNAGINGTGQRIVIAGQTQIVLSDIQHFRSEYGLPANDPTVTLVPGSRNPGISQDDLDEAHLDLEWSGAAAPNATLLYVYAWDVLNAVQYAVDQNLAPVISTSYGSCELELSSAEADTLRGWAKQGNAQGITWFSSSGDTGAADCSYLGTPGLAVDIPASIPEVTAIGGTEFLEGAASYWSSSNSSTYGSALSYIPEVAWNDSALDGEPSASGGGISQFFPRPDWQTGAGVSGDNARHVPDISMNASADHDGYLVYTQGDNYVYGGTSVPAPIYAGVAGLLNQYLVARGVQSTAGVGNINPQLYTLAASKPEIFHDIVAGDNIVTVTCTARARNCTSSTAGYSAAAGYDPVTGLGSVDVYQLLTKWTASASSTAAPVQLTLQSNIPSLNSTDTVFLTTTATATDGSTPTGTVTFTQGTTPLDSATLIGTGGIATATLAVAGSQLAAASETITATLNGIQTATLTLSLVTTSIVSAAPVISTTTNAASFGSAVAPGSIVSIFGTQLAPSSQVASSVPLPFTVAGVAATVNGVAAPIWYVSPGQINLQIPYEVAVGSAATLVINNNGKITSAALTVNAAAPGIFTDSAGALTPASAAAAGEIITLYMTGAGLVSPAIATGSAPIDTTALSQLPAPEAAVTVTVGGISAPVTFAGIPSGLVGVTQINFQVPALPVGSQPVVVSIGGVSSPAANLSLTQ